MSEFIFQSINVGTEKISGFNELGKPKYEKTKIITLKKAIIIPFIISKFAGSIPEINGIPTEQFRLEQNSNSVVPYEIPTKEAFRETINSSRRVVIDVEELMGSNKVKSELKGALNTMQKEIEKTVWNFENKVVWMGYLSAIFFLLLSLPFFFGAPALVGSISSLGLPVYVKIRRWERKAIE